MTENKTLKEIYKQVRFEKETTPPDQWNHDGKCYACSKYGYCDGGCAAYIHAQAEHIKQQIKEYFDYFRRQHEQKEKDSSNAKRNNEAW